MVKKTRELSFNRDLEIRIFHLAGRSSNSLLASIPLNSHWLCSRDSHSVPGPWIWRDRADWSEPTALRKANRLHLQVRQSHLCPRHLFSPRDTLTECPGICPCLSWHCCPHCTASPTLGHQSYPTLQNCRLDFFSIRFRYATCCRWEFLAWWIKNHCCYRILSISLADSCVCCQPDRLSWVSWLGRSCGQWLSCGARTKERKRGTSWQWRISKWWSDSTHWHHQPWSGQSLSWMDSNRRSPSPPRRPISLSLRTLRWCSRMAHMSAQCGTCPYFQPSPMPPHPWRSHTAYTKSQIALCEGS